MDRSFRQNIRKETLVLNNTLDQMNLIDICRTFYLKQCYTHFFFFQDHTSWSSGVYPRDVKTVLCLQINQHNTLIHHTNKLKNKSHVIILIDAEKAFDKMQHPLMIKTLNKVGVERIYPDIILTKAICDKGNSNSMVKSWKHSLCDQEQDNNAHSHQFKST